MRGQSRLHCFRLFRVAERMSVKAVLFTDTGYLLAILLKYVTLGLNVKVVAWRVI